jgi:ATP/maltotriose-dependent transcriptional regulator MalT
VDYLRARYTRAEIWLTDALDLSGDSPSVRSKATTYLGGVASDRGDYPRAATLLSEAIHWCQEALDPRMEAFARSMLGRLHLLRGDLAAAADELDASIERAQKDHWLAFLPWPQAHRGEVQLRRGDAAGASELLEQAFARACQLGNPCWEGTAARGLALVADARGDAARAFEILADASSRSTRLADPYVWLAAYILDARCELGRRHGHPETGRWIERLKELTSRTGMRELGVRALLHGAALGTEGDAEAASLLAAGVENPELDAFLDLNTWTPTAQTNSVAMIVAMPATDV